MYSGVLRPLHAPWRKNVTPEKNYLTLSGCMRPLTFQRRCPIVYITYFCE